MLLEPKTFRDKIAILDERGSRRRLYPAEVSGVWRKRRTLVQLVLIAVFLILPWIKIGGHPLVLFDLVNSRFHLFGLHLWAHDVPMAFFVLGLATVGLALATALVGRVWCGWACPQTVFIDGVFRRIEVWLEGSHLKRRELDQAPWSTRKVFIKTTKWFLFSAFTLVLTHSFLAYFVGGDRLIEMVQQPPAQNWGNFVFVFATAGVLLFDLAWFREQFCMIVCPYGRIQSVLFDRDTLTVQYDAARGEPRRGSATSSNEKASSNAMSSSSANSISGEKSIAGERRGDCVGCQRCVNVCPTGIDIRNGIQMECIACTACIDACDEIMLKVKKPVGLIRYKSSAERKTRFFRSRVLLYSAVLLVMLIGLVVSVGSRRAVDVVVLRAIGTPFFEMTEESGEFVVNSYRLHLHNHTQESRELAIGVEPPAEIRVDRASLALSAGESKMVPFIVRVAKQEWSRGFQNPLKLKIEERKFEVQFVGPSR